MSRYILNSAQFEIMDGEGKGKSFKFKKTYDREEIPDRYLDRFKAVDEPAPKAEPIKKQRNVVNIFKKNEEPDDDIA